jgi:epoxide hydrolase 4
MNKTTRKSQNPRRAKKIIIVLGLVAGVLLLAWLGLGPVRAAYLENYYGQFRLEHQAEHDALDAQFTQKEASVNGIKWHYVDQGPADGPVVLLLHGLPEGWYSWKYVIPLVDPKYRLIVPDMKGYGRSVPADSDYNWHKVAAQTIGLMDYLKVDRFYVVGHDWGTLIGTVLVNDHPKRVLGFVRMEADFVPGGSGSQTQAFVKKPQWLVFQVRQVGTWLMQDAGWFIDNVYKSRMTTPFKQEDRDYFVYEFSRPGVADRLPRYFESGNWDLQSALYDFCKNNYPFPALALQADSDPAQPKSIFANASTECPNVELKWITNAGHFDNLDQPGQVAAAINEFLQSAGSQHQE